MTSVINPPVGKVIRVITIIIFYLTMRKKHIFNLQLFRKVPEGFRKPFRKLGGSAFLPASRKVPEGFRKAPRKPVGHPFQKWTVRRLLFMVVTSDSWHVKLRPVGP